MPRRKSVNRYRKKGIPIFKGQDIPKNNRIIAQPENLKPT